MQDRKLLGHFVLQFYPSHAHNQIFFYYKDLSIDVKLSWALDIDPMSQINLMKYNKAQLKKGQLTGTVEGKALHVNRFNFS